jgi:methionine-rich copper-binding protein CopC
VIGAMLAFLVPATPASAHTELSRTAPAAKSRVTKPLTDVSLTFSGLVRQSGTTVAVTGTDKVSYAAGAVRVVDRTATQKVNRLPVGVITVAWRTVAGDGHALRGSFTFTNAAPPPSPTAASAPTVPPSPATGSAPPSGPPLATGSAPAIAATDRTPTVSEASDRSSSAALWWTVAGVGVLVVALLGGLLWWRRRGPTQT